MKTTVNSALACITILFTAGCATQKANDKDAPTGPPAATLTFKGGQTAYYGAAATGSGTISYRGTTRNFNFTGVGAGGTGVHTTEGVGEVYNLKSLSDFAGAYTGVRTGLTLFKGKMSEKFTSDKGVVIYVTGETTGLASSTGVDTMTIGFH